MGCKYPIIFLNKETFCCVKCGFVTIGKLMMML